MIVDLNLRGKSAVVIGGGREAQKRIRSLSGEGCSITVLSGSVTPQIDGLAKSGAIRLERQDVTDAGFVPRLRPDIIITATDDMEINRMIIAEGKRNGIITYSSDDPDGSDFSNPAVIDIEDTVKVAIFTGGRSPAMAKRIRAKSEEALRRIVTGEDIARIRIHGIAREIAKEEIPAQPERKTCLEGIMSDAGIDQLIKDGRTKEAEARAIALVRDWGYESKYN